jgi:hypothetical protein
MCREGRGGGQRKSGNHARFDDRLSHPDFPSAPTVSFRADRRSHQDVPGRFDGTVGRIAHSSIGRGDAVRNDPWNAIAVYNGRRQSLHSCLLSWRRDARRGSGALGTITTSMPVQIEGWSRAVRNLGAPECLDLLAIMPSTYSNIEVQRLVS